MHLLEHMVVSSLHFQGTRMCSSGNLYKGDWKVAVPPLCVRACVCVCASKRTVGAHRSRTQKLTSQVDTGRKGTQVY